MKIKQQFYPRTYGQLIDVIDAVKRGSIGLTKHGEWWLSKKLSLYLSVLPTNNLSVLPTNICVCCNEECGWKGVIRECVSQNHEPAKLLCPACNEVVE